MDRVLGCADFSSSDVTMSQLCGRGEALQIDAFTRVEKCDYLIEACCDILRTKDGDKPRKLPVVEELKRATDITKRSASPYWDFKVIFDRQVFSPAGS